MNARNRRRVVIAAALLVLALTYLIWKNRGVKPVEIIPPPSPPLPLATPVEPPKPVVTPPKPTVTPPTPVPPPVIPTPPKPPVVKPPTPEPSPSSIPKPPAITLHPELIPKNIEIVRVYYDREIMGPKTTFGFDINGSGFTAEFRNMIRVDPGGLDIEVKNLRLVTANQIHGELVIGEAQTTEFIYPKVLIRDLPVFRATDPFAVVRPGEVLVIVFRSLSEDGRSGKFRVVTNLDETMAKQFRLVPSNSGLEISPFQFQLPWTIEGTLQIGPGVPQGEHGLSAFIGQRQVYNRDKMIRIVRPNVGTTGFVQGVSSADIYHRPGDTVQLYLHGSGLTSAYTTALAAKVNELDMGPATFQYISPSQMRFTFQVPATAPLKSYGVTVLDQKGNKLFERSEVFTLVPANWIGGVQVAPPLHPGQQGQLRVMGRDLSSDLVRNLQLTVDEPGITLKNLRQLDATTLTSEIAISSGIAPGDYWIHLHYQGKEIQPPYGSIIKIEPL